MWVWILVGVLVFLVVVAAVLLGIFIPKKPLSINGINNIPPGTYLTPVARLNALMPQTAFKQAVAYNLNFQETPVALTETGYLLQGIATAQDSQGSLHALFHFNKIDSRGVVTNTAFSRKQWSQNVIQPEFTLTAITPQALIFDMAAVTLEVVTANTTVVSVYSSQLSLEGTLNIGQTVTQINFDTVSYIFALCSNHVLYRISNSSGTLLSSEFTTGVSSYTLAGSTLVVQLLTGVVNLYSKSNGIWTMTSSSPVVTNQTSSNRVCTTNAGKVIVPSSNGNTTIHSYFAGNWSSKVMSTAATEFPFVCVPFTAGYEEALVYTESDSLIFQKINSQEKRQVLYTGFFEKFQYPAQVAVGIHNRAQDQAAYVVLAYAKGYTVGATQGVTKCAFGLNMK